MKHLLSDIGYFLAVGIIGKKIIEDWLADKISAILKWCLTWSEEQVIYYLHYKKRVMHEGHRLKQPSDCRDDECILI